MTAPLLPGYRWVTQTYDLTVDAPVSIDRTDISIDDLTYTELIQVPQWVTQGHDTMASQLTVYNNTLALLQQSPLSTPDPNPTTESSRMLNANWESIVETCFEQGDWDFAQVRGILARSAETPAFGYAYYYEIPADMLRFTYVSETGAVNDPLLRYQIEGGRIATDATAIYATWVSTNARDTPGRWSATFARYVAAELAFRCLKLNTSAAEAIEKERGSTKKLSLGIDAVSDPPAFRAPGSWVRAIRSGSRQIGSEQGAIDPPPFN